VTLSKICKNKGVLATAGGSGAVALIIILVFLIPNVNANTENINELAITHASIITQQEHERENILEIKTTLKEMDDKLDKLTIITCKQSQSSLCN